MFDDLKNMAGLMRQLPHLRQKMAEVEAELARRTVEGDAGAGAVRVTVNGKMEVLAVRLDRPLLASLVGPPAGTSSADTDAATQQMIEELIAAATNDALAKARELVQQEVIKAAGGLNLPGLSGLPGMDQLLQ